MSQNFVPEMHDLGKLAIREIAGDNHAYTRVDWSKFTEPQNLTWYGIKYHMHPEELRELKQLPPQSLPSTLQDPGKRKTLFLLILADHLAATVGRAEEKGGKAKTTPLRYKLWQPDYVKRKHASPEPICDDTSLRKALGLVSRDPIDAGDFFRTYHDSLLAKGEDKTAPNNVTSLYSHLELTGKFFRALEKDVVLSKDPLALSLEGETVTSVSEADNRWVHRMVIARVKFHQQPVRPADLMVFERFALCKHEFEKSYPDNLLFSTADALWLFLPGRSKPSLEDMLRVFTDAGFYVECELQSAATKGLSAIETDSQMSMLQDSREDLRRRENEVCLELYKSIELIEWLNTEIDKLNRGLKKATAGERRNLGKQKEQAVYWRGELEEQIRNIDEDLKDAEEHLKELEKKSQGNPILWENSVFYPSDIRRRVPPHICEICQVRHGEERVFGGIIEHLCPRCLEIREGGFSQRELGRWLQEEERLLWLKITLDPQQLRESIQSLFRDYVDSLVTDKGEPVGFADRMKLKLEVRTVSLLADFVKDYNEMLEKMNRALHGMAINIDQLATEDLWVMTIQNGPQLLAILRLYFDFLSDSFPCLLTMDYSPVRLGVSLAAAKYPFFQHWRYVSDPQKPISINVVGKTRLETTIGAMRELLRVDLGDRGARKGRSYLHNLARIEEETGSTALAQVKFLADVQRRREVPDILTAFAEPLRKGVITMRDILSYYKIATYKITT